ncbi:hypothetical protein [Pelosinus propionicus]|uniref:Uncharacterized protein n=1 Tax=Pelosinus propionicus DSM 13327 TaxID=1123291 RepID=A0A1I4PGG6_9FIRM|nr:hypothetical protein [Pelosinus propionicus]SFM26808.1 hypothetical protein SAMN04490355_106320 [Pelosinus propionicus DSM 13327]
MNKNKPIELNTAIQQNYELLNRISPALIPRKGHRPNSLRTVEKAIALSRSVFYCVKKAEEDGYIVKEAERYKMLWAFADTIIEAGKIENSLKRQMNVAAIISTELEKRGESAVMAGVSAVEFYTVSNYLSRNIDFIISNSDTIKEVMSELGFKNDIGTWYLSQNRKVLVEFHENKGSFDFSWKHVQTVAGPNNTTIKIIGIEDVIVDRAIGAQEYKDTDEWVKYLMVGNYNRINWDYLNKRAYDLQCEVAINSSYEWAKIQRDKFIREVKK